MSISEELFVGIISGVISGIIVGFFLLWLSKINCKIEFFRRRISNTLKKYELNKNIEEQEKKYCRKFGILLDNGHRKLEEKGFAISDNGNTIRNNSFYIHLTRISEAIYMKPSNLIRQFLIRKLIDGKDQDPEIAYYSEKYHKEAKEKNKLSVLYDFINYIKN